MSVSGVHAEPARDIVQYRAESIRKERKNKELGKKEGRETGRKKEKPANCNEYIRMAQRNTGRLVR